MISARSPAVLGKSSNETQPRSDNRAQGQQKGQQAESKATVVHPAQYPGDVEIRIHSDAPAVTLLSVNDPKVTARCEEAQHQVKIVLRGGLYGAALTFSLAGLTRPAPDMAYGVGWVFLVASAFLGIGTLFMTNATTSARRGSNSGSTPPSGRSTRSTSEHAVSVGAPKSGASKQAGLNAVVSNTGAPNPVATNLVAGHLNTANLNTANRVQVSKPYVTNGRTVLDVRTIPAAPQPPPVQAQEAGSGRARDLGMALTGACIGISLALLATNAMSSDADHANVAVLLLVAVLIADSTRST